MLNSTNYSREFKVWTPPPPEVYVPMIISFIIGILTDPLPPDRDDVTIIAVFLRLPLVKFSEARNCLGLYAREDM